MKLLTKFIGQMIWGIGYIFSENNDFKRYYNGFGIV